jgi:hypothetical protein
MVICEIRVKKTFLGIITYMYIVFKTGFNLIYNVIVNKIHLIL